MRLALCLICAGVAAGCGDAGRAPAPAADAPAPVVRSADHDARDDQAAASDVPTEADGTPIAPEPQGTEPDKGTPGVQDATGGKLDVAMRDRRFTPRSIAVRVGQIVVFTNDDDMGHTVRAAGGELPRSGLVPAGGRFEFTPLRAGRVRYRCIIHPRMGGTLRVRPQQR